ncbi:hypothetical protein CIW48_27120 [Methylobacterium sp. P1-11]|uniref:hypothetical protein n=1 Tax=Methylobacterium sp. P1-11 TaxID=2024616 RepID=UPI0011EE0AF5|nr:hypothetical protein [Methylobacterium sp. P1-11]KAA0117875.1 hypothetical protein CIW48_27120 [Methylobacterium sp. P1-11]
MAKAKTIKIASRLHTAVTLGGQPVNPERPGEGEPSPSFTLAGADHPGQETISEIDAEAFGAWKKANDSHPWLRDEMVREVPDDYESPAMSFGHEPALEALSSDKDNSKLAKEGTGEDQSNPVPAEEMAATSDTPNDDSPRSQVGRRGRSAS